jgi:hypothetical protein
LLPALKAKDTACAGVQTMEEEEKRDESAAILRASPTTDASIAQEQTDRSINATALGEEQEQDQEQNSKSSEPQKAVSEVARKFEASASPSLSQAAAVSEVVRKFEASASPSLSQAAADTECPKTPTTLSFVAPATRRRIRETEQALERYCRSPLSGRKGATFIDAGQIELEFKLMKQWFKHVASAERLDFKEAMAYKEVERWVAGGIASEESIRLLWEEADPSGAGLDIDDFVLFLDRAVTMISDGTMLQQRALTGAADDAAARDRGDCAVTGAVTTKVVAATTAAAAVATATPFRPPGPGSASGAPRPSPLAQ